ncbi:MAG: hypothetical protein HY925_03395 [Elusimicrobia bacterium]|nr:hypothetical protein [Elusimicrobiota bacterium]
MGNRLAVSLALSLALLNAAPGDLGTSVVRPLGLPAKWEAEPLGWVRVTQYTHVETNSRLTSSGYVLKDRDEGLVCAISRDWWRSRVKPGDLVWVTGFAQPCAALDTMATHNPKGLAQTRWIDIYVKDPVRGLAFGIKHSSAYIVHPVGTAFRRVRTTAAARRLKADCIMTSNGGSATRRASDGRQGPRAGPGGRAPS